ncbi:MAG TPA: hypothetical protein VFM80_05315, partial [Gracilimonas sp.]|uniref:hypothetical protein n=1 Tax=Gracilimonas sp. TaxID=1974203 RepID=UPI002D8F0A6E|nr:hypothetical protein [Gracilimonas sp.]
ESEYGDLDILQEYPISFKVDVLDLYQETFKQYLEMRKEQDRHLKGINFDRMAGIYLMIEDELIPPLKKWKRKIRNLLFIQDWSNMDLLYWIKGQELEFYEGKNTRELIISLSFGYNNAYHIFKALSADIFYFLYSAPSSKLGFDEKNQGKRLHLNEILELDNQSLNPPIFFGGGYGSNGSWLPDPTYRPN